MDNLILYIDGASKGNPGESSFAFLIYENNALVKKYGAPIGITTNNVAEYFAFIFGIIECVHLKVENLTVYTDSLLLVKQLKGEYKVKNEWLKRLHFIARNLMSKCKKVEVIHIPREKNKLADKLANLVFEKTIF